MTTSLRGKQVEHPFMRRARALSRKHNVPLYLSMSAARREDPQSYRHFNQTRTSSRLQSIKKVAPDAAAVAWDAAVATWSNNHGISRCEAMREIRKRAPELWKRYR